MGRDKLKVFIDANVWYSYFYGSANCEKVINAHLEGKIQGFVSEMVVREVMKNLKLKLPKTLVYYEKLLLAVPPVVVRDPVRIDKVVQADVETKDQAIFQAAVKARIKYFVTGNTKDFKVGSLRSKYGIEIITPSEMAKLLD